MATKVSPRAIKLYIAPEDLKERYVNSEWVLGEKCVQAYVKSVEKFRRVKISVDIKMNGTVEFTFDAEQGNQEGLTEAKRDIQGEVCSVEAIKKYEQPPKFLPSAHIKHKEVSKETLEEMPTEDQMRLQPNLQVFFPLSIDALEKHDMKHTTGPCQLRQFGCPQCQHSWWRNVLKSKPVSRCRREMCGNMKYDALPRDKEFGIGRCLCSNESCGREFYAYCEASETLECRKCKSKCRPLIHPKWRKKNRLNPNAKPFIPRRQRYRSRSREDIGPTGPLFVPVSQMSDESVAYGHSMVSAFSGLDIHDHQNTGRASAREGSTGGGASAMGGASRGGASAGGGNSRTGLPSQPPKKPRKKIFNASKRHIPTGGTMSTFLSQIDYENERSGMEVDLDYDSDDDEEKVGVCKLECDCRNEYTVVLRMMDKADCHRCGRTNNPLHWEPPRDIHKISDAKHSCSRCSGQGECPNLTQAKLDK